MEQTVESLGNKLKRFFRNVLRKQGNVVIFLFIWVLAMIFVDNFATLRTNVNILKQSAIPIIGCLGMTFVLITGGIDLSIGYTVGLCSYFSGVFVVQWGVPPLLSLLVTLVIGAVCGLFNGILVTKIKIPAFIVTLGSGYVIYGLAQILSNGNTINDLPEGFLAIGRTEFLGLQTYIYISIIAIVICYYLLHISTFGRSVSAMGLNPEASRLSGINTKMLNIMVYVICSMSAALAGVLLAIRVNNSSPVLGGMDFTFETITAAILGGASLFGGKGTVWGAVLGMLTIKVISASINMLGINAYITQAILGIIILIAIIFESVKNRIMQ